MGMSRQKKSCHHCRFDYSTLYNVRHIDSYYDSK